MENKNDWRLEQLADFFYLLVSKNEKKKDILQKRFKRDISAHALLYDLIEKIDEMGYEEGVEFAFNSKRFKTIKHTPYNLIEIRRLNKTWRVIAYWNKQKRIFVLLDAFEAHKDKSMNNMLKQIEPRTKQAIALTKGSDAS